MSLIAAPAAARSTVLFTDAAGNALNGKAPDVASVLGNAFDPEGFVVNPKTGNPLVSDEYGASVHEFDRSGKLVRDCAVPANIKPTVAGGAANYDADANTAGRRINRGFEGLAISPDGRFACAMLQSAMVNEGSGSGVCNRIVEFDTATGRAVAQYAYKMEGSSQGRGISALVAINDHEFLVLELPRPRRRPARRASVPEPRTTALLLTGLGVIGWTVRRRRR